MWILGLKGLNSLKLHNLPLLKVAIVRSDKVLSRVLT